MLGDESQRYIYTYTYSFISTCLSEDVRSCSDSLVNSPRWRNFAGIIRGMEFREISGGICVCSLRTLEVWYGWNFKRVEL